MNIPLGHRYDGILASEIEITNHLTVRGKILTNRPFRASML